MVRPLVGLYPFKAALADGSFCHTGIGALLAIIGILITAALLAKKSSRWYFTGYLVYLGDGHGMRTDRTVCTDSKLGAFSVMPNFSNGISIPSLARPLCIWTSAIATFNFITIMLSFMFVDLFDTLGTFDWCCF